MSLDHVNRITDTKTNTIITNSYVYVNIVKKDSNIPKALYCILS